jgi:hypothetical protein
MRVRKNLPRIDIVASMDKSKHPVINSILYPAGPDDLYGRIPF